MPIVELIDQLDDQKLPPFPLHRFPHHSGQSLIIFVGNDRQGNKTPTYSTRSQVSASPLGPGWWPWNNEDAAALQQAWSPQGCCPGCSWKEWRLIYRVYRLDMQTRILWAQLWTLDKLPILLNYFSWINVDRLFLMISSPWRQTVLLCFRLAGEGYQRQLLPFEKFTRLLRL